MSYEYYHCTENDLEINSIIKPGKHYRAYNLSPVYTNNLNMIYYEFVLEHIRILEFQNKPSRYDSMFVCKTKEALKNFINLHRRQNFFTYKVKSIENNPNIHIGDYTKCQASTVGAMPPNHIDFLENARTYWKGFSVDSLTSEVLIKSPIQIVEKIDLLD